MGLDKARLSKMLLCAADELLGSTGLLNEIDSMFGDGDHGITIGKIAEVIKREVSNWGDESAEDFLFNLEPKVMMVNGGSAGPLYGTMLGGLSGGLSGESEITAEILKKMFSGSLSAMRDISTAKVGDKTMMDALIPAVEAANEVETKAAVESDGAEAAENEGDDVLAVLTAAAEAAAAGAEASKGFVARFGRAKSYKEKTIGTPDAGAMSTAIFFRGLLLGYKG